MSRPSMSDADQPIQDRHADFHNPVTYREWHRILTRQWMSHLTPAEFVVVSFVFDRTVGWGKEWETVTRAHLVEGVWNADRSVCYHGGTGLSESTAKRTLDELLNRGAILRKPSRHITQAHCLALNFEWNPMLRLPRNSTQKSDGLVQPRSKGVQSESPRGFKLTQEGVQFESQRKGYKSPSENPKTEKLDAPSAASGRTVETAEEAVASVRQRNTAAKVSRLSVALAERFPSTTEIEFVWNDAIAETFKGVAGVSFTVAQKTNLKRLVKRWNAGKPDTSFGEFIRWVVTSWRSILAEGFQWMTKAPEFPALAVFIKCFDRFVEAWRNRAAIAAKASLSPRERFILALTEKGVDRAVAEQRAEEKFQSTDLLIKIKTEQQKLDAARRSITRQQEEAQKAEVRGLRFRRPVTKAPTTLRPAEPVAVEDFGRYEEGTK